MALCLSSRLKYTCQKNCQFDLKPDRQQVISLKPGDKGSERNRGGMQAAAFKRIQSSVVRKVQVKRLSEGSNSITCSEETDRATAWLAGVIWSAMYSGMHSERGRPCLLGGGDAQRHLIG